MVDIKICAVCSKSVPNDMRTGMPTYYKIINDFEKYYFCDAKCSNDWDKKRRKK